MTRIRLKMSLLCSDRRCFFALFISVNSLIISRLWLISGCFSPFRPRLHGIDPGRLNSSRPISLPFTRERSGSIRYPYQLWFAFTRERSGSIRYPFQLWFAFTRERSGSIRYPFQLWFAFTRERSGSIRYPYQLWFAFTRERSGSIRYPYQLWFALESVPVCRLENVSCIRSN